MGPPSTPVPRRHVLVVDDEADIGAMLELFLADRFRVTVTTRAEDALDHLRKGGPFDVVLCDLLMPEKSGIDLYEEVHRADPALAARFIFMTGGTPRKDEAAFLRERSLSFVYKPLDVENLEKLLIEIAHGRAGAHHAASAS
jgi:DNA-binding NtrC family response regulator